MNDSSKPRKDGGGPPITNAPPDRPGYETTNHDKYTKSRQNPIVGKLMDRFFATVAAAIEGLEPRPSSALDAGCGEGHAIGLLRDKLPADLHGCDLNPDSVAYAQSLHPAVSFSTQSVYALELDSKRFDLSICLEVLEHLERPRDALAELCRVTREHLVLSVPHEPWFMLGNLARFKHVGRFGNHPEHINHWHPRSFRSFLSEQPQLTDVRVVRSFPWLVATARVGG